MLFIDDEIRMEEAREIAAYSYKHFVTQRMEGEYNLLTGFAGFEDTLARFASIYAGEDCSGMNELAIDALGEFMNCQNGLFLSNLSHKGIELELFPSEIKENGTLQPVSKMYIITCHLSFGRIDFLFSDKFPIYA